MSGLIWIQTVWHSAGVPEIIFWKSLFWKEKAANKRKHANLSIMQRFKVSITTAADLKENIPWHFMWMIDFKQHFLFGFSGSLLQSFGGTLTLCMLGNFSYCSCCLLTFFFHFFFFFFTFFFFKKLFQEHYQSFKRFGSRSGLMFCQSWSRSGPMFCQSWSGPKLFAKVISRWQKLSLARKGLWVNVYIYILVCMHECM